MRDRTCQNTTARFFVKTHSYLLAVASNSSRPLIRLMRKSAGWSHCSSESVGMLPETSCSSIFTTDSSIMCSMAGLSAWLVRRTSAVRCCIQVIFAAAVGFCCSCDDDGGDDLVAESLLDGGEASSAAIAMSWDSDCTRRARRTRDGSVRAGAGSVEARLL